MVMENDGEEKTNRESLPDDRAKEAYENKVATFY